MGSKEVECPKQRGFWDGVDFRLSAMTQLTERRKERRRKRQSEKSQYSSVYKSIENVKNVCMKMHEHVICNSKSIIGSAQSKPTSTHVCNKVNTHLRMHETLL